MKPPRKSKADTVRAVVKSGIASVPIPGSAAVADLFGYIWAAPLEKRREEWMEAVTNDLTKLQNQLNNVTPDALRDDEGFVTTLVTATIEAMKTHDEERLHWLRAAVVNSALENRPDEDLRQIFLRLAGELTPSHVTLMVILNDPDAYFADHNLQFPNITMGSRTSVVRAAGVTGDDAFVNLLVSELGARGLLPTTSLGGMMSEQGLHQPVNTPIGSQFLNFIQFPDSWDEI